MVQCGEESDGSMIKGPEDSKEYLTLSLEMVLR